jgi:hypothetical protein
MPDFLLNTHSSVPDADVGCRVALVTLDKKFATLILKRLAVFKAALKKDNSLFELQFWDSAPEYLSDDGVAAISEEIQCQLDMEMSVKVKSAFRNTTLTEDSFQRTEVELMTIREDGVAWSAMPKHADVRVETEEIRFDVIRKIAGVNR